MANKQRGEAKFDIKGKSYILRPTFEALCQIEDELGESIISVAGKNISGTLTLPQIVKIIEIAIVGEKPDANDVGETIVAKGVNDTIAELTKFLTNALAGGSPPKN